MFMVMRECTQPKSCGVQHGPASQAYAVVRERGIPWGMGRDRESGRVVGLTEIERTETHGGSGPPEPQQRGNNTLTR